MELLLGFGTNSLRANLSVCVRRQRSKVNKPPTRSRPLVDLTLPLSINVFIYEVCLPTSD